MEEFRELTLKERLLNIWYTKKKYLIIVLFIIVLSIISLIIIFNKKDSDVNRFSSIESIMIYQARDYIKNNNLKTTTYISLNNLNIEMAGSLNCNSNSGVLVKNNEYIPYLMCDNYYSKSIQEVLDKNKLNEENAKLKGDNPYVLTNGEYQEFGIELESNYKVNIKNIDVENGVNVITYNVLKDNAYSFKVQRVVIADNIAGSYPTIELLGQSTRTIPQNTTYIESGYSAIDKKDGNITNKVKISGNVDTSKEGTYTITYSVTNTKGKTAEVKRKIIVTENKNINLVITSNVSEVKDNAVNITINISGQGYQKTVLPNESSSNDNSINYTVYKDGSYDFVVYDTNNNVEVTTVSVNKFALLKPVITSVTKNGALITVNAKSPNGISGYLISKNSAVPTGNEINWVNKNVDSLEVARYVGKYYVYVKDKKNQYSDYKEIEITINDLYDKGPKSRTKDYVLSIPIEEFLASKGDNISNLNNFIATSVLSAGLFTREGSITSAVALFNYLYLKYSIQIPYFSNINCSGTRYYKYFGASNRWGVAMDYNKCHYKNVGFDCASFVGWAVHNGGFQGKNTIGSYSSLGATVTKKCNQYGEKVCLSIANKNTLYPLYKQLKAGDLVSSDEHVVFVLDQYDDNGDGQADGIYIYESHGGAGMKKFSWEFLHSSKYYILSDMTGLYNNPQAYSCKINAPIPEAWSNFDSKFNNCEVKSAYW